jgi:hypothetical protein
MAWRGPRPKAKTVARGYGGEHVKLRAKLLPQAWGQPCVRCGRPMLKGQALHFDHSDDRRSYLGFSHAACNRRAGARKGQRLQRLTLAKATPPSSYTTRW